MSRFSNLEFHSDSFEQTRHEPENAPKDESYFMSEAQTAFEAGDFEGALRFHAKALEQNPKNPKPWTGQVRMLIELGEFREAKLWAGKALEQFPHEPELLAAKAVALARMGDFKAAMAFSDAAFEERGDSPYLWIARADVLFAQKEARADYCLERALTLDPANWLLRWLVSRVLSYYGRFVHALKAAQEAIALDATRAQVWLQAAFCQQQLGLDAAAAASATHALQLSPRNTAAKELLTAISETSPLSRWRGRLRHLFGK